MIARYIYLAIVAAVCSSCTLNVGHGLLAYSTEETRLGASWVSSRDARGVKNTAIVLDTKGAVTTMELDESIRAWAIRRLKEGETVEGIAKALGINPQMVRDWIE